MRTAAWLSLGPFPICKTSELGLLFEFLQAGTYAVGDLRLMLLFSGLPPCCFDACD